ncbi:hypothetical protein GCM10015535_35430 [Streptomyces gelaticus]|uniref:Uncharacterized protein n=1 Tax=Streptomyces gelaticus TaxID=285446 RepID=A0ABQ2W2P4_9ACTN|nr:hypothetical protein GCM10015535_35430 [Streptomyces gelaticus]
MAARRGIFLNLHCVRKDDLGQHNILCAGPGLVRDQPVDPRRDGTRLLVGCSHEHLAEVIERYKGPFMDAELWAGKASGLCNSIPKGSMRWMALARKTGLTCDQVRRGAIWQNTQAQRSRARSPG